MQHPEPAEPERSATRPSPGERRSPNAALVLALGLLAGALSLGLGHREQATPGPAAQLAPVPLADFRGAQASPDARLLANWVAATGDNGEQAFILVDKKQARVHVFSPDGKLQDSAPALLGEAAGDELLPGAAEKEPSELRPEEKTTPAGRYEAIAGVNADDEDVIWVDNDAAISMHRLRHGAPGEQRAERLASAGTEDNRISFGCINLPVAFYETVAKPAVMQHGAIIYVLPEHKTLQQVFGAYDVTDPAQLAAAQQARLARAAVPVRQTA